MNKDICNYSFAEFQAMNRAIYGTLNRRNYSNQQMISRIHRNATQVLKSVRTGNEAPRAYYLCMAFSWSLAFANQLGIDLGKEIGSRFPGVCPYCGHSPCSCDPKNRSKSRLALPPIVYDSVAAFQAKLAEIYPKNTLLYSAMHMAEEVGEVDEMYENFSATHMPELFDEVVLELVDVIANTCAVASCSGITIADHMQNFFFAGCSKCHQTPCGCGYVIANSVSVAR